MKKKFLFSFLLFIFAVFLIACNDKKYEFKINGVKGYEANVSYEDKTVSFNVNDDVTTFDTADLILPEEITLEVFTDDERTSKAENPLKLKAGLNTYYLVLSVEEKDIKLTDNWDLLITKNEVPTVLVTKIEVSNLKQNYKLNEEFTEGKLLVTYSDNTTSEVAITKDMVKGFDTSTYGEKTISITYEGRSITYKINVEKVITEVKIGEYKESYFVNDEAFEGKLVVLYDDESSLDVVVIKEMIDNFDTTTPGKKELTINYEGYVVKVSYEVLENTLESISVKEDTITSYVFGAAVPKINVLATYKNGETVEVEALVTGFDSTVVGKQVITLSYEGKTTTLEIEILNTVLKVEVLEFKDQYYLNEEYVEGKLLVTYADLSTEEVIVTKNMLTGFDTSTEGKKTVVISYLDQNLEVEIEVLMAIENIEHIYVSYFKRKYLQNEAFVNGELTIIFKDKHTETLEITENMVSGFDSSKTSWQVVTIKFLEYEFVEQVLVSATVYDDFELPTPTKLDSVKFKEAFKDFFMTVAGMTEEDFEEQYARDEAYFLELFGKTGVSPEQFDKLYNIYFDKVSPLLKEFIPNPLTFVENLTESKVLEIQLLAKEILNNISVEQIVIIIVEGLYADNGYHPDLKLRWYFNDHTEYNFDQIKELVNNPIIEKVADYLSSLGKVTKPNTEVMFSDLCKLFNFAKHLILAVTNINPSDLLVVAKNALELGNPEADMAKTINNLVQNSITVLRQLIRNTNSFEGYEDIRPVLNKYFLFTGGNQAAVDQTIFDLVGFALKHAEFILTIAENLTENALKDLINFPQFGAVEDIDINNSGLRGYVYLAQIVDHLYEYLLKEEPQIITKIKVMYSTSLMTYEAFDKTILNLKEVVKLDANNINYSTIDELQNSVEFQIVYQLVMGISNNEDSLQFENLGTVPVLINTDVETFKNAILKVLDLRYKGAPVDNSKLVFGDIDLTTKGLKLIEVTYESFTFNIQCFVLEQDEISISASNSIINNISEVIYADINNVEATLMNTITNSHFMHNGIYISSSNYMPLSLYVYGQNMFYEIILHYDESKIGTQMVVVEYKSLIGSFYDFAKLVIYDEENPSIVIENDRVYKVNEENTKLDISIDYRVNGRYTNIKVQLIFTEEDFLNKETGDLITKEIVIYTTPSKKEIKHTITCKYYKPEDGEKIYTINLEKEMTLPVTNPKQYFDLTTAYYFVEFYNNYSFGYHSFKELKDSLEQNYGFVISYEIDLDLNSIKEGMYNANVSFYQEIYSTKEHISTSNINIRFISDHDFHRFNYGIEYKDFSSITKQIASKNDITIDLVHSLLVNNIESITKRHSHLNEQETFNDFESISRILYEVLEEIISYRIQDYENYYLINVDELYIYFYFEELANEIYNVNLVALKPLFLSEIKDVSQIVEIALTDYYNLELLKFNGEKLTYIGKEALDYLNSINAEVRLEKECVMLRFDVLNRYYNYCLFFIDDINLNTSFDVNIEVPSKIKNENLTVDNLKEVLIQNNAKLLISYFYAQHGTYQYDLEQFFNQVEITRIEIYDKGTEFFEGGYMEFRIGNLTKSIYIKG